MGCKTGRSAFELAKHFHSVTGLDATARLIRLAVQMQEEGFIRYYSIEEDSANLPAKFAGYSFVLAENVLERSANPAAFLKEIPLRMLPGGILVIADSYNWNDEFTMPENRLGAYRKDGEPVRSWDTLCQLLAPSFELLSSPFDVLQSLKHSQRSRMLNILQVSVWKLKQ
jgi:SAM-dependent methyltransferase